MSQTFIHRTLQEVSTSQETSLNNIEINNTLFKNIYSRYDRTIKEFYAHVLTDSDYMKREALFFNFCLDNDINNIKTENPNLKLQDLDINIIEIKTRFKATDILKYILQENFDINQFQIKISTDDSNQLHNKYDKNKYIYKSPLKKIISYQKEFIARRNSLEHRNSRVDDKYFDSFIRSNKGLYEEFHLHNFYIYDINGEQYYNTSKKYLYAFVSYIMATFYIFLYEILDDINSLDSQLEKLTNIFLFLNHDDEDAISLLSDSILSMIAYNDYKGGPILGIKSKFLMSNLCQIMHVNNSDAYLKYSAATSKTGAILRSNKISQMVLAWIAENQTVALDIFEKLVLSKEVTEEDIMQNIIFSKMDNNLRFNNIYRQAYGSYFSGEHHFYNTKAYFNKF